MRGRDLLPNSTKTVRRSLTAALVFLAAACAPPVKPPTPMAAPVSLKAARFSDLEGWNRAELAGALEAFRRSCGAFQRSSPEQSLGGVGYAGTAADWRQACNTAAETIPGAERAFFESEFVPYRVSQAGNDGLFTGYYEPELSGSRTRHDAFQTPLYGVPNDLVTADLGLFRDSLKGQRIAGRVANRRFVPYAARAEIVRDGLMDAQVLFWVDDPTSAFFLQIQGSGRIRLDDGEIVRAAYAAQNGRAYTAIGRVLVERGELTRDEASLQTIRAWLLAHPTDAGALMNENASYVFFSEQPIGDPALGANGGEGVPLTPAASLAVDRSFHALGVPVFLEATAPDPDASKPDQSFDRLLVMQDTGGAIAGPIRGDVYWGWGKDAESVAGRMRSEGRMTVLLPKSIAARLGPEAEFASRAAQ